MKSRTFCILTLLLLLFPAILSAGSRPTPEEIVAKVGEIVGSSGSVSCRFNISGQGHEGTSNALLLLSKDRFSIDGSGYRIWFDGATQWTLNEADKEVTVSEPTPAELEQINPFAIVSSFKRAYDAGFAPQVVPGTYSVVLKAKSPKAPITRVELTVNSKTYAPTKFVIVDANGNRINVNISSFVRGAAVADSLFRFDPKSFPGVEINDMR